MMVERTEDIELQVIRLKFTYPVRHFLKMPGQKKKAVCIRSTSFIEGWDSHVKFPYEQRISGVLYIICNHEK